MRPSSSWASYWKILSAADRCPIAGPCPECADSKPHYCALGERLRLGVSKEAAFGDAVAALLFADETAGAGAVDVLLSRLCCAHRREARALLAAGAWPTSALDSTLRTGEEVA
jgi:hypothetical protein